ncbi:MAG: hypothetical protein KAT58_09980 [candidate division Zixibacteria bacterium]|nr:hypothetical protein [candidate division Zixibacteria bacterium]
MHLPINVKVGEGIALADTYIVGNTFPVFILTDSAGDVIKRWVGYNDATGFVSILKSGLSDPTTIPERLARFKAKPTLTDALFLAEYHADIGEYLEAVDYYRRAAGLSGSTGRNYYHKIFVNTANAVWNDLIPFAAILPAADSVLTAEPMNRKDIMHVAKIICRLARKKDKIDQVRKYLKAGLDAGGDSPQAKHRQSYQLLRADYALHVDGDTAVAIAIKKTSMGAGWENERNKFYAYANWCLERKINLVEAEGYTRKVLKLVMPGTYKAKVLDKLAQIVAAGGDIEKAAKIMKLAVDEDPGNDYYTEQLQRLQQRLNDR